MFLELTIRVSSFSVESTRVHLKMRPGEMGSDYINANYIDVSNLMIS